MEGLDLANASAPPSAAAEDPQSNAAAEDPPPHAAGGDPPPNAAAKNVSPNTDARDLPPRPKKRKRGPDDPRLRALSGVTSFERIIRKRLPYVDKTRFVAELAADDNFVCFFRPRRFGKTLLLDTMQCYLERKRDLFEGLYINEHTAPDFWEEGNAVPVIRLDMSGAVATRGAKIFREHLVSLIRVNATRLEIEDFNAQGDEAELAFTALLAAVKTKYGKGAAVLVDEVDSPILKVLQRNGAEMNDNVLEIQDSLITFLSVIKINQECTHVQVLTGIVRFVLTRTMSTLNHLTDMSHIDNVAEACGFTQDELNAAFSDQLDVLASHPVEACGAETMTRDDVLHRMEVEFGGWCFDGRSSVANPWDVISSLANGKLASHWIRDGISGWMRKLVTADPELLLTIAAGQAFLEIGDNQTNIDKELFDAIRANEAAPGASVLQLLLQAGLLAVAEEREERLYLRHVNPTVRAHVVKCVFPTRSRQKLLASSVRADVIQAYFNKSVERMIHAADQGRNYTVGVHWQNSICEAQVQLAHSVVFGMSDLHMTAVKPEYSVLHGRVDYLIEFAKDHRAIVEYKMLSETATEAARAKVYADAAEQVTRYADGLAAELWPKFEGWVAMFSTKRGQLLDIRRVSLPVVSAARTRLGCRSAKPQMEELAEEAQAFPEVITEVEQEGLVCLMAADQ